MTIVTEPAIALAPVPGTTGRRGLIDAPVPGTTSRRGLIDALVTGQPVIGVQLLLLAWGQVPLGVFHPRCIFDLVLAVRNFHLATGCTGVPDRDERLGAPEQPGLGRHPFRVPALIV